MITLNKLRKTPEGTNVTMGLKCKILHATKPQDYITQGQTKQKKYIVIADETGFMKACCYAHFEKLQKDQAIILQNYIAKEREIVITRMTKVAKTSSSTLQIPTEFHTESASILEVKPEPVSPIKEVLRSPAKFKLFSVEGTITQVRHHFSLLVHLMNVIKINPHKAAEHKTPASLVYDEKQFI